ncbi:ABC transporter permease subunit [Halostella salina]|uniref:ABC transporter permease subunit n=1 Tax=Halostella salina TaxID=1547897 RepID=UPI000EF82EE3|nr:ABC transporter permease subunit [Halostella salina]
MNWRYVARTDLLGLCRSRLLWLATAVVGILCAAGAAVPSLVREDPAYTLGVETLFIALGTVVPFVALGLGYRAVVGARESGTMRFLLGLPNRRLDVVVGRVLSRVAATLAVVAVGGAAGLVALVALYDGTALAGPLVVVLGLATMGVVYAVVGVAISASVGSSTKAVGGAFGAYALLFFLWERIPQAVYWLVEGTVPTGGTRPAWFALLQRLNPGAAIGDLTVAQFEWMRNGAYVSNRPTAAQVAGDVPFYLSDAAAVPVLLAWVVGAPLVGYVAFRRSQG